MAIERKWWHDKIVYQIYPMSFMDSNNDGLGDIKGIISKLDYLKELGVDVLWLTPFFASPMADNGYDCASYRDVNPMFGTNEDIDTLLAELKKRGMYLMIDVVANHTSDKHPWFIESRKSKDNPYRDYYVWRDEPLYDFKSCFGGSAWQYDETTKQYYLHQFAIGQPDLNWENPKVREAIAKEINYWMEKGVKGIRFDVIHLIGKKVDAGILGQGPTLHQNVQELYRNSYGNYDIMTVGEAWGDIDNAIKFTLPENKELNMVFEFEVTDYCTDWSRYGKFTPRPMNKEFVKNTWTKYQYGLNDKSWNALFIENHDLVRAVNKFGDPVHYYLESAKAIATAYFFQKGTPYIYQGQEIGMTNLKVDSIDDYRDVEILGKYKELVLEQKVLTYDEFMDGARREGRDNNRDPMQWDDSVNAGFNKGCKTWIKVNDDYKSVNVKNEEGDSNSILSYYKKMIALRKCEEYKETFVYGEFKNIEVSNKNVFIYKRTCENKYVMVIVNLGGGVEVLKKTYSFKNVLLSNYDETGVKFISELRPYECLVVSL